MELIDCPETSVIKYQFTLCNILEERGSHLPLYLCLYLCLYLYCLYAVSSIANI